MTNRRVYVTRNDIVGRLRANSFMVLRPKCHFSDIPFVECDCFIVISRIPNLAYM